MIPALNSNSDVNWHLKGILNSKWHLTLVCTGLFFCFIFVSTFFHLYYSLYCFSTSLLTSLCCSPHLQITLYKSVKKAQINVFSFIWFHYFNCCLLFDFLPRNLLKLAVRDVHKSFHMEVKTAYDAFFGGKYIDWAVPLSKTSGRLCYRLSNCTILSPSPPPPIIYLIIQRSYPTFHLRWSGGTGVRGLLVSGSSTGLLCQTESSWNRFCDWLGLFFLFQITVISYQMTELASQWWLEEWTLTEKGRTLQMADRDNM